MKNKLAGLLASTVFVMSLSSNMVFAMDDNIRHNKHNEEHSQRGTHYKFKKMANFLALTKVQRVEAKAIHQQAKDSRLVLKPSLQSFYQQSRTLAMAEQFDDQAFINLQSQYQHSFAQMALIKIKAKHSFMQILTEGQKDKMKTMKHDRMKSRYFTQ
jgi:protein CpxP